jgi:hypothetical protein
MPRAKAKTAEAPEVQNTPAVESQEEVSIEKTTLAEVSNGESSVVINGASSDGSAAMNSSQRARKAAQRVSAAEREKALADQASDIVNEASLRTAMNRRRIFNSKILAIEEIGSGAQADIAAVVLLSKNIKVLIPFGELFQINPMDYSRVRPEDDTQLNRIRRKRQISEKMIGCETPFIITNMEPDGDLIIAVGSRAKAMQAISERAFGGSNPRFKVGDMIEAQIISVSVHSLTVMFEGVDITIQQHHLTRKYLLDLRDAYRVGEPIYARIRGIKQNEDGIYRLQIDTIAVELEDAMDRYSIVKEGTRTRAIITAVFRGPEQANGRAGTPKIFAWIPNYELPVRVVRLDSNTFGREISAGTEVIVRVNRHADDGYLVCEAIYDYGNNSMFSQGRYW